MNIIFGGRIYELGKITRQKLTGEDLDTIVTKYFRHKDRPHVVRIDQKNLVKVEQIMYDPKLKIYDVHYRPMTFIRAVEKRLAAQDEPPLVLHLRSIRHDGL